MLERLKNWVLNIFTRKKYKLLKNVYIIHDGRKLYQIKALKSFGFIKKGTIGGYIESENNFSPFGDSWIYDNAKVYGNAYVGNNAKVYSNAQLYGNAIVYGNAYVSGNAEVYGNAEIQCHKDYIVFKNFWSSGRYFTWTRSNNMWKVGCFFGTGEELITKAYDDSPEKGKYYELFVNFVKDKLNN